MKYNIFNFHKSIHFIIHSQQFVKKNYCCWIQSSNALASFFTFDNYVTMYKILWNTACCYCIIL